jgi:C4-dicarboxylate-specific signal transduction histidine kinase
MKPFADAVLAPVCASLIEALAGNAALVDQEGTIVAVNEAWRRFAAANGYCGADFGVGTSYIVACGGEAAEASVFARESVRVLRGVLSGQMHCETFDYPCHEPDRRRWFRMLVMPCDLGARRGAIVLHFDVTEERERRAVQREELEDTLRREVERRHRAECDLAASEAERLLIESERLATIGGLVAGVAHEISGPIGAGLTVATEFAGRTRRFAERIQSDRIRRSVLTEFADCSRNAVEQIVPNLQRAAHLLDTFKKVAAADPDDAARRLFDLKDVTEQVVTSLAHRFREARSNALVQIPAGIMMDSYAGSYRQVLTNLLLNAVTHGLAETSQSRTTIDAVSHADQVEITVADNGKGVPETLHRQIFNPFFTTARAQGNLGLGLHIVQTVVTGRLGGRIALAPGTGRGATFRLTLPICCP